MIEKASFALSVAIPASLVSDIPHLREKTSKLGLIARTCAIFGVQEIILYVDDARRDQQDDLTLCEQILGFIETPQYLRKRIFRLSPVLRFAGILPPLQTPHHAVPASIRESKIGDIREGVVVARRARELSVDVGLESSLKSQGELPVGSRVSVRLSSIGTELEGEIVDRSKISIYWGYRVTRSKFKLARLIEEEKFDLKIGTSRYGTRILDVWAQVASSLRGSGSVLLTFGSPRMGLQEILDQEDKKPGDVFDYYLNTIPHQNVSTVRTEEAILITLAVLNVMRSG